jgi:pimeloyl-ACP methyl ester carboxylesterase
MKCARSITPILVSMISLLPALAGCSDSTSPAALRVFGGPNDPAPDGSYTDAIVSPNGIASLEPVTLGGVEQWILIRGYDVENPVLIFLHGGPGSPAIPYARYSFGGLERHFTVVVWDQRGCGKSYHAGIDPGSITLPRLLADAHELITMMSERFGVDKVYLMGLSWGSHLGTIIARDHPELLHAYVGIGQAVHSQRGLRLGYEAALDRAIELGVQEAIDQLSAIQTEPSIAWDDAVVVQGWLEVFGYGDLHDTSLYPELLDSLRAATEYTAQNIANEDAWQELYGSSVLITDQDWFFNLDLLSDVPRLEIPVYFMAGRFDYKTPTVLVEEYYAVLEAPAKRIIYFENSGHIPNIEEREAFHSTMIDVVLAETASASSASRPAQQGERGIVRLHAARLGWAPREIPT